MPDAVLLCGGAGLRLRSVTGNAPKAMASIGGRPFLELLLRQLERHGFSRVILAVGYQKEAIASYFGNRALGLKLEYSAESAPLGTGGALRNAAHLIESDIVVVMNGDTYTNTDLSRFVAEHSEAIADASVLVALADARDDCGAVLIDQNGRLTRFEEKQSRSHSKFVNAGIYILPRTILSSIPSGVQSSLERELLPRWLEEGKYIRAVRHMGTCTDIGTPERYHNAEVTLSTVESKKEHYL
jgi:NDP-sugar pyrophosphorylase family protein